MRARLFGFLPFDGRDKYQDGRGRLQVRALGFQVVDEKGPKVDASELVTVLAEALFIPAYALQPYISWQAVDDSTAKAALTDGGISVTGTFHFNASGECERFETRDRWQSGQDAAPVPWTAFTRRYADFGGMRLPTEVSAVWHAPGGQGAAGDFEYVHGVVENFTFDVGVP
jgi:hypothetical protein